jgi:hypothetical protein
MKEDESWWESSAGEPYAWISADGPCVFLYVSEFYWSIWNVLNYSDNKAFEGPSNWVWV